VTVKPSKGTIKMTEETTKTRRGVQLYKSNPFMVDMTTRTRRITNKRGDMMLVNSETGEIGTQIAGFWEAEEVDSTKFIKLFVKGVKALKELSGSGTKVFEFLYLKVQDSIGKDKIYMSFSHVDQALTPMSESTYSRGMRELVAKKFIAPSEDSALFWLNPSYVWNGDRLAFVKEYRKASSPKGLKDDKTKDLFSEALPSPQMVSA
jgi:hypothetical protein